MSTPELRLRAVNLNLMPILREILRHRNLTRAAETLNLTQSAVSNSLRQLREHFEDELLVRDGRNMRLTAVGQKLLGPVEEAMEAVRRALIPQRFDAMESRQRFRIATADYVMAILAPPLSALLQNEGPGMSVQMLSARRQSGEDLRVGRVDMVIMPRRMLYSGVGGGNYAQNEAIVQPLMTEQFVVVGHEDDPDMQRNLTAKRYLERAHAGFFLDFDVHASLEQFHLNESGIRQFERILTSSFCTLPLIAATGSCLTLLPESMARSAVETLPLKMTSSPIDMPKLELIMVTHQRRADDDALNWLATALKRSADQVMEKNATAPPRKTVRKTSAKPRAKR